MAKSRARGGMKLHRWFRKSDNGVTTFAAKTKRRKLRVPVPYARPREGGGKRKLDSKRDYWW